MNAFAHFLDVNFTDITTGRTRSHAFEPEPVVPARPMVGLLGLLSEDEIEHALAYDGPQDHGDEAYSLATRAKANVS